MTRSRKLAYLALLTNVVIWGAALPIVKPALTYITPFQFLFYRYLLAAAMMVPILWVIWPKKLGLKQLLPIILLESLQVTVSLSLLYLALSQVSALTAALLGSTAPIFVTLGGIILLKEREDRNEWFGLGASMLGTVVVILASTVNHGTGNTPFGVILMLGYLFANTAYLLLAKKHYQHQDKRFIAGLSSVVGLISYALITPLVSFIPPPSMIAANSHSLFAVLYMGILGSSLAVALLLYGQSRIEASEASLFTYLQPLIYIPLSVLWLKEVFTPYQLIGLIIILLGVFLAERRPRQKRRLRNI